MKERKGFSSQEELQLANNSPYPPYPVENFFQATCELNQIGAHSVVGSKNLHGGATKPKCVEKKFICKFSESKLQILTKYYFVTSMVTIINQIPRKNLGFETMVESTKHSFHKFMVPINMIGNGFFEATF
jgi:hypothetical protein